LFYNYRYLRFHVNPYASVTEVSIFNKDLISFALAEISLLTIGVKRDKYGFVIDVKKTFLRFFYYLKKTRFLTFLFLERLADLVALQFLVAKIFNATKSAKLLH